MNIAYFDTIAGISGDMVLGAFLNAGLPLAELNAGIAKLGLPGVSVESTIIQRSAIAAARVQVIEPHIHDHAHGHEHKREHSHHTGHGHSHEGHERNFEEIRNLIESSSLDAGTKEKAVAIFSTLAVAEAHVHNTTVEKIHFHEVGAVDSIVDIVGAVLCMEYFGIEAVYTSPVRLGSGGTVTTRHGEMPIPVPATVEILKGYPTILTDIPHELTTPTGAAIVRTLSRGILHHETVVSRATGYGAGSREIREVPNLLRVVIGEMAPQYDEDEVLIVETNIDDMNPEIYPYVIEQLIAGGAHDAYLVPIVMKKGRPGILLSAMVQPGRLDDVIRVIYSETTTIGLRILKTGRRKLQRRQTEIVTSLGKIRVKVLMHDGKERATPEFEECKRIATEHTLPLKDVYEILQKEINEHLQ